MNREEIKQEWRKLCKELDFQFLDNIGALLESPRLTRFIAEENKMSMDELERIKSFLHTPLVQKILDRLFLGMGVGKRNGFECFIHRSTESSENRSWSWSNVAVFFNEPYRAGLSIRKTGFFSPLSKRLFPRHYIRPANPELDRLVSIKGKDRERIGDLASYAPLLERLRELYSFSPDFKIDDAGIRVRVAGDIIGKETAIRYLDIMTRTAQTFF